MNETPSDLPKPLRHYAVVRIDPARGEQIAQLGHAWGESAVLGTPPTNTTIVVGLEGELDKMQEAITALRARGIKLVEIYENEGRWAGQLMAFGVEPTTDNRVRKILYHFEQIAAGPDETMEQRAERLFNAYNEQGPNPWKTFDGRDVPRWPSLSDQVRQKWLAVAAASL
jgi:hypothetical protein